MLPGVELARRRRMHYHGDAVSAGAGEHHHHHHQMGTTTAHAVSGVVGPALAARIRLEEKLRGAAASPAPTPPSWWGRRMRERDGRAISTFRQEIAQQEQQQVPALAPAPPPLNLETTTAHRAEMRRTLSKTAGDLCAVCLDEVREQQQVTRLPCSHKYHSGCVLPWLAIQPDCPCCRTPVPSVDTPETSYSSSVRCPASVC